MIVIGMPVERAASRLIHLTTTPGTIERCRHALTHCHWVFSFVTATLLKHQQLHNTPDTTNLTESKTNLAKGFAASIPPIIGNSDGAAIPATSTPTCFTLRR
jgi:hypothetical protein